MTISTIFNKQKFIICVVQNYSSHSQQPDYCCQTGVLFSNVKESCNATLTSLY